MPKNEKNTFDVLLINNLDATDIIQSIMGDLCLGTLFDENYSKIYFRSGSRKVIEEKLIKIMPKSIKNLKWEIQTSEDWHLKWQKNFTPIIINQDLAVLPYWNKSRLAKINLYIKPGMAFGTGHHESTWLMLNAILENIKNGMKILDLGTGSGILSIAAYFLGGKHIDAVENDIDCKENFFENMNLNKISNKISFYQSDVLKWNEFDYDIILANINRNVIEKLLPNLKNIKSKIILSGLILSDLNRIKKLCNKLGFFIKNYSTKGDWICLIIMYDK